MLLFVRKSIRKGIKVKESHDRDILGIELCKSFFGLDSDLNIWFPYASPSTSPYTKARQVPLFDSLEGNLLKDKDKDVLLMRDLNGKTSVEPNYISNMGDKFSPMTELDIYTKDVPKDRNNMDTSLPNEHGKNILDICKSHSLRILNGRTLGDRKGTFTRYPQIPKERPRVIDYAIISTKYLSSGFRIMNYLITAA